MKAKPAIPSLQVKKVECLPTIHQIIVQPSPRDPAQTVPVVDGWIQANLFITDFQKIKRGNAFSRSLKGLVDELKRTGTFDLAYIIHKPPGIKLRLRIQPRLLALHRVRSEDFAPLWSWLKTAEKRSWIQGAGFDSFLEQHHLFIDFAQPEIHTLLDLAFSASLKSQTKKTSCSTEVWAQFIVDFLNFFYCDPWWVWEALKRHETLRTSYYLTPGIPSLPLYDPREILKVLRSADLFKPTQGEIRGSTSLLLVLSYLLNLWAVDPRAEQEILTRAIEKVAPAIL